MVSLRDKFKYISCQNGRFFEETYHFLSLRGAKRRGNLKVIGMTSRGEAREHGVRSEAYNTGQNGIHIIRNTRQTAMPRVVFAHFVTFLHISLRDGAPVRQRLPRRAHMRPPRNDKFDRLCEKTGRWF